MLWMHSEDAAVSAVRRERLLVDPAPQGERSIEGQTRMPFRANEAVALGRVGKWNIDDLRIEGSNDVGDREGTADVSDACSFCLLKDEASNLLRVQLRLFLYLDRFRPMLLAGRWGRDRLSLQTTVRRSGLRHSR